MNSAAVVHAGGPTEEALFAFRAGRLRPEAAGWIGDHVDSCQRCRRAMARIDSVREALEPPPSVQAETQEGAEPSDPDLVASPEAVEPPASTHVTNPEAEEQSAFAFSGNKEPAGHEALATEQAASPALLNGHQRDPETTITHHD